MCVFKSRSTATNVYRNKSSIEQGCITRELHDKERNIRFFIRVSWTVSRSNKYT